jgi:ribonuclease HII
MLVIGVDEAGYGAIAGPLVVAAVAYSESDEVPYIDTDTTDAKRRVYVRDSKNVTAAHIIELTGAIEQTARSREVAVLDVDPLGGPYAAKMHGLQLVTQRMVERLHIYGGTDREAKVIIDGHVEFDLPFPFLAMPKADERVWQVSAASILAKAEQLARMEALHKRYPRYAFKKNKGYPTPDHLARLKEHGPCKAHRRSTKALAPWAKKPKGRE